MAGGSVHLVVTAGPGPSGLARVVDEAANIFATAEQILSWAETARAGDEFVYATRCSRMLPAGSAGAAMARDLASRGLVNLAQRRIPDRAERNYVAQRTSKPFTLDKGSQQRAEPRSERPIRVEDVEAEAINAILPILARRARFGRPCPTDHQLHELTGVASRDVKPTLEAMCEMGMIRMQSAPAPTLRFVTIVATGHKTGLVA